jgi:3-oxoacyl-ACP reductase-like protein
MKYYKVGENSTIRSYINSSLLQVRMRLAAQVAHVGQNKIAYRILVGKPEVKRPLGRPRRRWEGNVKIELREIGWVGMYWIDLAQDRDQWWAIANTVMNLRVP